MNDLKHNKIFDGNDWAVECGYQSHRQRITMRSQRSDTPTWTGKIAGGEPVFAYVHLGVWIADCECGGKEAVTPDDPIFFCFSCGNLMTQKAARKVIFPPNKDEIERALMERPNKHLSENIRIQRHLYNTEIRMAFQKGQPPPLTRTWHRGETKKQLRDQHKLADKIGRGK